jgi:hypothetical protein
MPGVPSFRCGLWQVSLDRLKYRMTRVSMFPAARRCAWQGLHVEDVGSIRRGYTTRLTLIQSSPEHEPSEIKVHVCGCVTNMSVRGAVT